MQRAPLSHQGAVPRNVAPNGEGKPRWQGYIALLVVAVTLLVDLLMRVLVNVIVSLLLGCHCVDSHDLWCSGGGDVDNHIVLMMSLYR